MFASALLCMSRERQAKVLAKLVADAALKGHMRRTYIAHLEAMASVLSPSGMALAAHAYKVSHDVLAYPANSEYFHVCTCVLAQQGKLGEAGRCKAVVFDSDTKFAVLEKWILPNRTNKFIEFSVYGYLAGHHWCRATRSRRSLTGPRGTSWPYRRAATSPRRGP